MLQLTTPAPDLPRSGSGRPTREQAQARVAELLDAALAHFLDKGYELATIEAIAASVNMTKRTVYVKFADKSALFIAAVSRAIERVMVPDASLAAIDRSDLEASLVAVAKLRLRHLMTDEGLMLQRIINTESYRFPQIMTESFERGAGPIIDFVAQQLVQHSPPDSAAHNRSDLAASAFMSMVIGGPVRMLVTGMPLSASEIDDRIAFSVRLFVEGAGAA